MRKLFGFLSVMLVACSLSGLLPSAKAQPSKGTVSGIAKDSGGSPLQGARVQLDPTGKQVATEDDGQFRLADVAAGDYTLTVSYVGLAPFSKAIKVEGDTKVDVQLEVASRVDSVVVSAGRVQGEAEAINIERTSEDIVQVLPAELITSLPNTNIADAVGRAPSVTLERDEGEGKYVQIRGTEPRLSNVTINGVHVPSPEATVRNIKLDTVPSDIVERIEVFKTLSPNQDADAIGGTVNLVTKSALEKPTFDFASQGGYTPIQDGRTLYGVSGTVGERFGVDKKLGILVGATYDHNNRGIDDLEPSQAIGTFNGNNFAYINGEDFRTYHYDRGRYGFDWGADYNVRPGTTIYFKGLYADFHDYGSTFVYTPNTGNIVSHDGSTTTFDNTGNMAYREYIRRPDQGVYSIVMGANHAINSTVINYQFAISRGHNRGGQDFATTNFSGPSSVAFGLSEADPYKPYLSPIDGTNIYNPSTYSVVKTLLPNYNTTELDFEGTASLAHTFSVGSHYSTFEMGLEGRDAHKRQNENDQEWDANSASPFTMSQVLSTSTNPNYYNGYFGGYGPLTDYGKIQSLLAGTLQSGFTLNVGRDHILSDPATWDTSERIWAGYFMDTITFGKLRLQGGLRIESTGSNYGANMVTLNNGAYAYTTPLSGTSGYVNFMPSVQAQYQLPKDTVLRLSYGRGISRPNFSDIVPAVQVDPNASPKSVVVGNPALNPTKANNYDILIDHYFQSLGIIQFGYFYKALTDPIYPTVSTLPASDPNFPGYLRYQSINGPSANIQGVEMAWQQRLSFLPGMLSGFGVAANYSYTTSQVTFPAGFSGGRIDHPGLQRQAPNTWNLGFTYDKARFSMRFGASHNDANIYAYGYVHSSTYSDSDPILGTRGPLGDQYLYAHTQYDIQGSYRVYRNLQFVVSGLNLSNEVFGFYTGSPIYPNQREFYKPTVIAGVRWVSGSER
jgi:TonB-dependent receptor